MNAIFEAQSLEECALLAMCRTMKTPETFGQRLARLRKRPPAYLLPKLAEAVLKFVDALLVRQKFAGGAR